MNKRILLFISMFHFQLFSMHGVMLEVALHMMTEAEKEKAKENNKPQQTKQEKEKKKSCVLYNQLCKWRIAVKPKQNPDKLPKIKSKL